MWTRLHMSANSYNTYTTIIIILLYHDIIPEYFNVCAKIAVG